MIMIRDEVRFICPSPLNVPAFPLEIHLFDDGSNVIHRMDSFLSYTGQKLEVFWKALSTRHGLRKNPSQRRLTWDLVNGMGH